MNARARRTAWNVTSVPVQLNTTRSAEGTISISCSASSTSSGLAVEIEMPCSSIARRTAALIRASLWPSRTAPNDWWKSMYSFPSTSQIRDPWARVM